MFTDDQPPTSARRTTSHVCTRPDGLDGPVHVRARGRDLATGANGSVTVADAVDLEAEVRFDDGTIAALRTEPALPGLGALVGTTAFSGFRRAAREVLAGEDQAGSLHHQLLDDLPVSLMLSGRVLRVEGIRLGRPGRRPPVDLCAGWVDGGTLVRGFTELGPPLHVGPVVPPGDRDDEPTPPLATCRRRRLDVWLEDDVGRVEGWFRDSHADRAGTETVVHEYSIQAQVDLRTREVRAVSADPGTLPAPECPTAAASVARLVGTPVGGLRELVSATMTGPSTCTHLNDALRSLEGVGTLLDTLAGRISA